MSVAAAKELSDHKPSQVLIGQGGRPPVDAWLPSTLHDRMNRTSMPRLLQVAAAPAAAGESRPLRSLERRYSGRATAAPRVGLATAQAVPGARSTERKYRAAVPPARSAEPAAGRYGLPAIQFLPVEIRWREAKRPQPVVQTAAAPAPAPQPPPDLARLTREVSRELEKRLRIERERRGRL